MELIRPWYIGFQYYTIIENKGVMEQLRKQRNSRFNYTIIENKGVIE